MAMTRITGLAKLETVAALTMALVFGVVAGILGLVLWFSGYSGGSGVALAIVFSLVLMALQWWFSPYLIRLIMRLEEVKPEEHEWLHTTTKRLADAAGIPMPKLYVADNPTPNAFAFGRSQRSAGLAVHSGLLKMLDKHEVEAVLAHEVGHIKHRDMIVMTLASVLPMMLYYITLVLGSRDRDDNRGGNSAIFVFFGAMFARLLGTILVMWLSRIREYYADEFSARVTGKPQSLMAALSKISYGLKAMPHEGGGAVRAFYIADPETSSSVPKAMSIPEIEAAVERDRAHGFLEILMTHPLTSKRLLNLKRLETEA